MRKLNPEVKQDVNPTIKWNIFREVLRVTPDKFRKLLIKHMRMPPVEGMRIERITKSRVRLNWMDGNAFCWADLSLHNGTASVCIMMREKSEAYYITREELILRGILSEEVKHESE